MTQASEHETRNEHGEGGTDLRGQYAITQKPEIKGAQGEPARACRAHTTDAARVQFAASAPSASSRVEIWRRAWASVFFRVRTESARLQTGPGTTSRVNAWADGLWIRQVRVTGMALLSAGIAPALVMIALWHDAEIAPFVFSFTFVVALGHGVLLALPLFLVFRSMGWINFMTCVAVGFAVGAAPVGALTWSTWHFERSTGPSVVRVLTIIGAVRTAEWINYIKPVIYFGSLGALGGFVFWVTLTSSERFRRTTAACDRSEAS